MARIKLINVSATVGNGPDTDSARPVFKIENLNLTITDGKVMAILGPSGCGKSTLLRLIAGLLPLSGGQVLYDGQDMIDVPPNERNIGMVFQDYALYPQYTSQKNIMAYFTFHNRPNLDEEARRKYERTSQLMGVELKYLLNKKPKDLSSGEKQRVAIARCITRDPQLFLMDEPFANLDQKLRERYRVQLKRLLREFSITTVYVTHDQQEALALADSIAIMRDGAIEQVGPARLLYDRPTNLFVADFLNFDQTTPALNVLVGESLSPELAGHTIGIRPEDLSTAPSDASQPALSGPIIGLEPDPIQPEVTVTLSINQQPVALRLPQNDSLTMGDQLTVYPQQFHIFDAKTGRRLDTRYSDPPAA